MPGDKKVTAVKLRVMLSGLAGFILGCFAGPAIVSWANDLVLGRPVPVELTHDIVLTGASTVNCSNGPIGVLAAGTRGYVRRQHEMYSLSLTIVPERAADELLFREIPSDEVDLGCFTLGNDQLQWGPRCEE